MAKQNIIMIETKIYDNNGEELAVSVSTVPLEDGECNICRAEAELAHLTQRALDASPQGASKSQNNQGSRK